MPTKTEKLMARMEVCDELWRHMVKMDVETRENKELSHEKVQATLRGIAYMKEVVEAHRKTAQRALVLEKKRAGEREETRL